MGHHMTDTKCQKGKAKGGTCKGQRSAPVMASDCIPYGFTLTSIFLTPNVYALSWVTIAQEEPAEPPQPRQASLTVPRGRILEGHTSITNSSDS